MSRRKAPSTGARPRCMMIDFVRFVMLCEDGSLAQASADRVSSSPAIHPLPRTRPTTSRSRKDGADDRCSDAIPRNPRPGARRRPGAPHGRRRQGAHAHRRRHHPAARARLPRRRNARASSSTPTAIRRASPIPACRWSPTACRILPARSPAFSPASIGRRRMRRNANGWSACRAIARSCRTIWWRGCMRRAPRPACRSPARARANGGIRSSGFGRWRCATICGARWSTKACARSRSGPRAMASPSPIGRPSRSIRSSTSTRPRTPRARECIAAQYPDV